MKKTSQRIELVWAARVNMGGLWKKKPIKCTWNSDLGSWWDRSGNFGLGA